MNLIDTITRYEICVAYLNNQTDEQWQKLVEFVKSDEGEEVNQEEAGA